MTKEITKSIILQRLEDRFQLREFEPSKFLFDETVVPVFEISGETKRPIIAMSEKSITSADSFNFYVVPHGEQWALNRYDVVFMGAGAYTVTGLYWHLQDASTLFMYLDMTAGQSASYHVELKHPVVLPPASQLRVLVDSYTSTQDLRVYIEYIKEEIR